MRTSDSADWQSVAEYGDITYHKADGMARIAFNRPEKRNAFRPQTIDQMTEAFKDAWADDSIGVVLLTGNGPSPKDGVHAFCAGGDQNVRGHAGYVDDKGVARLNVLELQRIMRTMPKPVIALVNGYAIGGGHVLHVICDLSLASENAVFGQTGPVVGSFDGGYGASYLASIVGQKKAREIWYLCRQYSAQEASGDGAGQQGAADGGSVGRGGRGLGAGDIAQVANRHSFPQGRIQRRFGRAVRFAGSGWRRHDALLHVGRRSGRTRRVQREAQTEFQTVSLETLRETSWLTTLLLVS